jgi:Fic family protein
MGVTWVRVVNTRSLHITPEILSLVAGIDEFKGAWRALGALAPERLSALRGVATIESIGSSQRIEGSRLSDRDVERMLANREPRSFATRDRLEVAGYADVMEFTFTSWRKLAFTEHHIKQLHQRLLRHSEKDAWHGGQYQASPTSLGAEDDRGAEIGGVFGTATSFDTPRSMTEWVEFVRTELDACRLHPLLVIAIAVAVFLEIHPFQDGNGRMSRVVTMWLLLRAGYVYVPYSSHERVIERNKEAYDLALRQTQATIRTPTPNWEPWLTFFLRALREQADRLAANVERESRVRAQLPTLSLSIVDFVSNHGRITMSEAMRIAGTSRNTLKQHFRTLVEQGHIVRHGKGRGIWYTLR